MKLSLDEIRESIDVALQYSERCGVVQADTGENDLYWSVDTDEWFDFGSKPEPIVGSLDDDIQELKKLLQDRSRASAVDLERLSAVFRLLSRRVASR